MTNKQYKKTVIAVVVFAFLLSFSVYAFGAEDYTPNEIIVKFKHDSTKRERDRVKDIHRLKYQSTLNVDETNDTELLIINDRRNPKDVSKELSSEPIVEFSEPNGILSPQSVPNDPLLRLQWYIPKINAESAWNIVLPPNYPIIAIVDSGVNFNHPDLTGQLIPGCDWNSFYPGCAFPQLESQIFSAPWLDHGTGIAGIISARRNNGVGIAGISNAAILVEKVCRYTSLLYEHNECPVSALIQGIFHASNNGARVINISLSMDANYSFLQYAMNTAVGKGVLFVCAAGNDNSDLNTYPHYPAAYSQCMTVSATNNVDAIVRLQDTGIWGSNWGSNVSVAAPGLNILTTVSDVSSFFDTNLPSGPYFNFSGTSFSSAIVSALAIDVFAKCPGITTARVRTMIEKGADPMGSPIPNVFYGHGRINAGNTMSMGCSDTVTVTTTTTTTTTIPAGPYFRLRPCGYGRAC